MNVNVVPGDAIWYKDLGLFVRRAREFWPSRDQTFEERVNAMVRFTLYATGLVYLFNRQPRYLAFGLVFVLVLTAVYVLRPHPPPPSPPHQHAASVAATGSRHCTRPTKDNPFGNVLLTEYADNPDRPEACMYDDVKDAMRQSFNHNLFRNLTDVYEKQNSQRQFYTMPNTTIPNNQNDFAQFLYGTGPTCKEKAIMCTGNF